MELLQKHFDIALETPDGIKKLRELILTLAMQGKLVPQDPTDQPASALLKEIESEKKRLVKEGKIRKLEALPPIKKEEIPFEIPEGWIWCRLGIIALVERGGSPRPIEAFITNDPQGLNWIKIGDTEMNGKYITSTREKIKKEGLTKTRMVYPGDFLLTNSMSYGRPYITKIEGCIHDGWLRIQPPVSLNKDFLYNLLSSPVVKNSFFKLASGAVVKNLNSDKVKELLIPLPPLAEQKRIVEKIDSLMILCDQLEKERNSRNEKRIAVNTTAINSLIKSKDKAEFEKSWSFINKNFDELYSVTENVSELKKAILTLAMQGNLVPQDPKDQPASELLKEIEDEKKKLIKEGKIRKQDPLPPIKKEEIPYEIPKGWVWTRLGNIGNIFNGNSINENEKELKYRGVIGIPYIGTKDVGYGFDKINYSNGVNIPIEETRFKIAKKGSVLICSEGGSAGKKCGISEMDIYFGNKLFALESYEEKVLPNIILAYYLTSIFTKQFNRSMTGIIGGVSVNKFQEILFPLCPYSEQKRIVEKIEQLMELCDSIIEKIKQSVVKQTALFDAVLSKI